MTAVGKRKLFMTIDQVV